MDVSRADHDRIVHEYVTQVNHRANNLLAVIQGIIRMSEADNVEDYKRTIEGRISALAQAHSLLSSTNWETIPLRDIICGELMNHIDPKSPRVTISGPDISLIAARAQSCAMVMHELATNATRYGAFSNNSATVDIAWYAGDEGLHYDWIENGVGSVQEPPRWGAGLRLVERICRATKATLKIDWPSSGVRISFLQPYDMYRTRESVAA